MRLRGRRMRRSVIARAPFQRFTQQRFSLIPLLTTPINVAHIIEKICHRWPPVFAEPSGEDHRLHVFRECSPLISRCFEQRSDVGTRIDYLDALLTKVQPAQPERLLI
ncbi:hypothetical protein ABIF74_011702 [Bradyrhizobium japonicum]